MRLLAPFPIILILLVLGLAVSAATAAERTDKAPAGKSLASELLAHANSAFRQGNYAAAVIPLRTALQIDPENPVAIELAAELMLKFCDRLYAAKLASRALRFNPSDPAVRDRLHKISAEKADQLNNSDLIAGAAPGACKAQSLNRAAIVLAESGKTDEALQKFDDASRIGHGLVPKADYNAGATFEQAGDEHKAFDHFLAAYRGFFMPDDELDALNRMVVLSLNGGITVPSSAEHHFEAGAKLEEQKKNAEAAKEFESALAQAPWMIEAYYSLAVALDGEHRDREGLAMFRIYRRLAPDGPHYALAGDKIAELEHRLGIAETPAKDESAATQASELLSP
ncbi:MAG TPA: hypothetical protein VIX59_14285 [Candidatus Binataceae bacterium]